MRNPSLVILRKYWGATEMRALPTLAHLAAHPERILELSPEAARALLLQLATLQAPLLAQTLGR